MSIARTLRGRVSSLRSRLHPAVVVGGVAMSVLPLLGCDGGSAATSPTAGGSAAVQDGRRWFAQACAACHGPAGQGVPHQGPSLRGNAFVAARTDDQVVEFLKVGRGPNDPMSVTKIPMPPRGGKADLTDDHLRQITAYLRELQKT